MKLHMNDCAEQGLMKIPISGLLLKTAPKIAKEKGFIDFKDSYGWFDKF